VTLSRREEYAQATKTAVLHAAEQLFTTGGVSQVSVDEIAASARVSKGTVYHHFEDKAALFGAVYRRHLTWVAAEMGAAATRHVDPWRQLSAAAAAYLNGSTGEWRPTALVRAAPAVLGTAGARSAEGERLLPALAQMFDRLSSTRQLVVSDARVAASLVLAVLREAALIGDEADDMSTSAVGSDHQDIGPSRDAVLKGVDTMLHGLRRPTRPRAGSSKAGTDGATS
jgi:AcrR family transcriptional regulator